eukprot:GHVU01008349.1.p1 GENE.GHVU01008349.1~~GHVU01008349.1.p1  ORF type:complete len:466 (+),score=29.12 GHVU01008349.1:2858-4255(+)
MVSDSGSNILLAGDDLDSTACICHILHHIVLDLLGSAALASTYAKLKAMSSHLGGSPLCSKTFKRMQRSAGSRGTRTQNMNKTWWSGQNRLFKWAWRNEAGWMLYLCSFIPGRSRPKQEVLQNALTLTREEWAAVEARAAILDRIDDLSTEMQAAHTPKIPYLLPRMTRLLARLDSLQGKWIQRPPGSPSCPQLVPKLNEALDRVKADLVGKYVVPPGTGVRVCYSHATNRCLLDVHGFFPFSGTRSFLRRYASHANVQEVAGVAAYSRFGNAVCRAAHSGACATATTTAMGLSDCSGDANTRRCRSRSGTYNEWQFNLRRRGGRHGCLGRISSSDPFRSERRTRCIPQRACGSGVTARTARRGPTRVLVPEAERVAEFDEVGVESLSVPGFDRGSGTTILANRPRPEQAAEDAEGRNNCNQLVRRTESLAGRATRGQVSVAQTYRLIYMSTCVCRDGDSGGNEG